MEQAVTALTRSELNEDEVALVVEKVLDEGDLDDDGKLSFLEFEAVISKAPDFLGYVQTHKYAQLPIRLLWLYLSHSYALKIQPRETEKFPWNWSCCCQDFRCWSFSP